MSCNIYAFVEVKPPRSHAKYVGPASLGRRYELFALMANVRFYPELMDGQQPLSPPRGLPLGVSPIIARKKLSWNAAPPHSTSWLSLEELKEVQRRYASIVQEPVTGFHKLGAYIAGKPSRVIDPSVTHEGDAFVAYGEAAALGRNADLQKVIDQMKALIHRGTPRLVFWFVD